MIIVGCGHRGASRIVERAKALFDESIYELLGGMLVVYESKTAYP